MMKPELFTWQMISLGLLILAAHTGARISRKCGMGEVVGQVLGGLLVGPVLLQWLAESVPVYGQALLSLHFFTFLFLSLIAFGIGDEFHADTIRQHGREVVWLTLIQGGLTWVLVTAVFALLGFPLIMAVLLGSIGIATAPAASFAIMNKLNIGGSMRTLLGGMVVLDDVLEVVCFSVFCQMALVLAGAEKQSWTMLALPVAHDIGYALALGVGVYLVIRVGVERRWLQSRMNGTGPGRAPGPEFLSRLISELPTPSVHVFLVVCGSLAVGVGLALAWQLPFLLTAVAAGILVANGFSREVFQSLSIQSATSMFTLVFFALIGANVDLSAFHWEHIGWVAAYVGARTAGKVGGTWLGCRWLKIETSLARVLPRLMLPQAGVAAVEAFYVATMLGEAGREILGIIIPGLIVFEVFGVLLAERSLLAWRALISGTTEWLDEEEKIRRGLRERRYTLAQLLKPECLRVPLPARDKGEAVYDLIQTVHAAGLIEQPGRVLGVIMERERKGGISLGEGVAILHGRLPELSQPVVALGVLPEEQSLAFGGEADKPCQIVYLVLSPEEPPELHLQVLAAVARFFDQVDARILLRHARSHSDAMDVIRKYAA